MKIINKFLLVALVLVGISCSNLTDLDINQNPNAPSSDQVDDIFLFNNVQIGLNNFFANTWGSTSTATRQRAMTSSFYRTAYRPEGFDGVWTSAYANFLQDALTLEALTANTKPAKNAVTKIMRSYVMTSLVDMFGDIPMSKAFQGLNELSPALDSGQDVYASALALLDEAITILGQDGVSIEEEEDLYYGGKLENWVRLANTLKLRIYSNTRLVDAEAGAKMSALIAAGDIITSAADDFQFNYGTNRRNPDSRHPFYPSDYEASDGGYMNNYYMWLLVGQEDITDPRTRFYFYRQKSGFSALTIDRNNWDCVLTDTPFDEIPPGQFDHVTSVDPNLPYCIAAANGYMGRDHGNGQGIPPDGGNRVEYGIYPGGGRWDDNTFRGTQNDGVDGSKGEGISPIWLSSFTDFVRAEAALTAGTGEDAKALMLSGVTKSISKVLSFASIIPQSALDRSINTPDGAMPAEEVYLPKQEDIDAYIAAVSNEYDMATDKLNVVMTQYYIAMFGNGIESYNMYRRTGKPNNMQPLVDPQAAASSVFPRLFPYPNNFVSRNSNANQRELSQQVFWDTNPAGFIR